MAWSGHSSFATKIFMDRFPVTAQGAALLQSALYAYDDSRLLHEAEQAAADFLGWMSGYFELDVLLLEQLRSLPETSAMALGMMVGACLAARVPISFQIPDNTDRDLALSAAGIYTFSGTYITAKGNLTMRFAIKK